VGFLKHAIYVLRAIEHPPRAITLTAEMIAVQASSSSPSNSFDSILKKRGLQSIQ